MKRLDLLAHALVVTYEAAPAKKRAAILDRFVDLARSSAGATRERILGAVAKAMVANELAKAAHVETAYPHPSVFSSLPEPVHVAQRDDVIGGFRVRTGHHVVDASVTGGLQQILASLR